jgi:NAD(P)-dependent dehydrogenase (short-subunit alcohol dehydrogenase family)
VRVVSIDPGEMNTRMHAEAVPDADPATLADPADVAARIAALVASPETVPSGGRIEAAALGAA